MKLIVITLLSVSLIACDSDTASNEESAHSDQESSSTEGEERAETDDGADDTNGASALEPTLHTVTTTEASMDFMPADLVIAVGDSVRFEMTNNHNAVEVSKETYEERGYAALSDGFNVSYGETQEVTFNEAGVHYYICQPHVMIDMIGTITVE